MGISLEVSPLSEDSLYFGKGAKPLWKMKRLWRVPLQPAQPSRSRLWVSSQPPSGHRGGNTWYFKMCPFSVKQIT